MEACQEFLFLKHKAMRHVAMMRNEEMRLRQCQDVFNNRSSDSTAEEEDEEEVDVGMPPTPERDCSSSTPGPQSELVIDTSYENDYSHRQSDGEGPWSGRKRSEPEDLDDEVFVPDLPHLLKMDANRQVAARCDLNEGRVLGNRLSLGGSPPNGELVFKVSTTRYLQLSILDWWAQIERVQELHESSVLLRMQEDNRTVELYARRMIPTGEILRLWQGGGFEMPMDNLFMNGPTSGFHNPSTAPGLLYKPPITRCPAPNCRLCEINRDIRVPPVRLPLSHSSPIAAEGPTGLDFTVHNHHALDADNEDEDDEEDNGRGEGEDAGSDVEVSSNISSRNCSSTDRSSPGTFPIDHSISHDLSEVGRLSGGSGSLVKCSHCDKQCRNKSSLLRHMKQHLEPHKQYTCEKCNKNFKTTSSLKQHMHIHSSVKPFKCDVCHKSYTQFSNLCRHKRMQAGCRSKIKCAHCGAEYTTSHSLERHIASCSQQGPHASTNAATAASLANPLNAMPLPGPHPPVPTSMNVELPRISSANDAIATRMPRVPPWLESPSAPSAQVDPYSYLNSQTMMMAMCQLFRARGAEEAPPASPPPPAHRREEATEQPTDGEEDQPLDLSHRPTDTNSTAPQAPQVNPEDTPNIFSFLRLPPQLFGASGPSLPPPMPVPYPGLIPGSPLSLNPAAAAACAAAMAAMVPPTSTSTSNSFPTSPARLPAVPRRPRSRPPVRPISVSPANGLRHSPGPAAEATTPVPPSPSPAGPHSPGVSTVRVTGGSSASRFPCTVCNKSFPRQANLNRHMRTHTGEQPYCCPVCRRPFSISSNMQRHVRNIHNQMRPHTCTTCSKRFAQRTNLERHLRLHERYGADIPEGASPVESSPLGASSGDESDVTGETGDVAEEMEVENNIVEDIGEHREDGP